MSKRNGVPQSSRPSAAGQQGTRATTPARRSAPRYRSKRKPAWWQGRMPIIGSVIAVALIIVLFIVLANKNTAAPPASTKVSPTLLKQITQVDPSVYAKVGTGSLTNPLKAAAPTSLLKGKDGKPLVLYVGAEYCPYCAAERWSMILALSRFGTFSNLSTSESASNDVYPSTQTFTFYGSTYTSPYIDFESVELSTNVPNGAGGYTTLQSLSADQNKLFSQYDAPPYTDANAAGGIPFIDIGNAYLSVGPGYTPALLRSLPQDPNSSPLSREDIAKALSDPSNVITKGVVGEANYLTAAICQITNNEPANVCTAAPIPDVQKSLPKGQ